MTAAVTILERSKAAGVTLWGEGGTLRYRGDKVAVESLLPMLKAHKSELLAALRANAITETYQERQRHDGKHRPDPELRRKVLQQLRDNPETTYAYVVDDPDTDPVIVGFGIRDAATCELAIPKDRFDPFEFLMAIKDMVGTA